MTVRVLRPLPPTDEPVPVLRPRAVHTQAAACIWMPAAALKEKLVAPLQMNAGLRFSVEAASIG